MAVVAEEAKLQKATYRPPYFDNPTIIIALHFFLSIIFDLNLDRTAINARDNHHDVCYGSGCPGVYCTKS